MQEKQILQHYVFLYVQCHKVFDDKLVDKFYGQDFDFKLKAIWFDRKLFVPLTFLHALVIDSELLIEPRYRKRMSNSALL